MAPGLLCFAVPEEFRPFRGLWQRRRGPVREQSWPGMCRSQKAFAAPGLVVILTGIGPENAEDAGRQALLRWRPKWMVTAGFAGGLRPGWDLDSLIFQADPGFQLAYSFPPVGFRPGQFTCQPRIACSRQAKAELSSREPADAVEMESGVLRRLAADAGIPSATARVISDTWDEDLPLDFNALMNSSHQLRWPALAATLARHPGKVFDLIKFQRRINSAAHRLSFALAQALAEA